jgi:hypothetical protein
MFKLFSCIAHLIKTQFIYSKYQIRVCFYNKVIIKTQTITPFFPLQSGIEAVI